MKLAEFERAFRDLDRSHKSRTENERCIECRSCERCTDCTFCSGSQHRVRCHYCVETTLSVDSKHCRESSDLIACIHCTQCERCSNSAYLQRCVDCSDCTYCFGCVGMSGAEFHILNQRYERNRYFEITAQLSRELSRSRR